MSPGPWFFDCDGVLLNSNDVKTEAFSRTLASYGDAVVDDVVRHHRSTGGISRFAKFERLFTDVLRRPAREGELEGLLERFAAESRRGLADAEVDPCSEELLIRIRESGSRTYVVSGGAEDEVRWVLAQRGLARFFDDIRGSPTSKQAILDSLLPSEPGRPRGYFVGDSRHDMEVAMSADLRPVFVSHWTEFAGWEQFTGARPTIRVVHDLADLGAHLEPWRTEDHGLS